MVSYDWLGPSMFGVALLLLAVGYPVAFTFGGVALLFTLIGSIIKLIDPTLLFNPALWSATPDRIFGTMNNFTLLAVTYFIFIGSMLEKSGIAEELLETIGILFGRIRGGLAIAVVAVGALLAATTGVVAATVIAMGLISLPTMLRYGYDRRLATGVIAASGTLGQIIPPSVVLVVLGDQLGVPVGALFIGALLPGLLLAGSYILHIVLTAWLRPDLTPALPPSVRQVPNLGKQVVQVMIPPLILILLILGSIFFGIATPTEAGAVGCVGAIVLAAFNQRLSVDALRKVCDATLRTTSMVMLILIGSQAFSLVFRGLGGARVVQSFFSNLPGGEWGFLFLTMAIVFGLGFFIDFFEIAFIVVPLCAEVARPLGIDLVWFGVLLGVNLQTSFLTPPFGFALFYLRNVAPPTVTTQDIYRGAIPFILIQLLILALLIRFPILVSWLPSLMASRGMG